MEVKAFIFDLDGVLTDTAEHHYQAWKKTAEARGLYFDRRLNERLKGVSRRRSLDIILEANGKEHAYSEAEKNRITEEKNRAYVEQIRQIRPEDVLPGIRSFLREAEEHGLKLAVASASKNAPAVLKGLQIENRFHYIADAARIVHTKPDPEVFLDCARSLGIEPGACAGFEDAQAGIEAIHAAGMYAVGIGIRVTGERPDLELEDTSELDFQKIKKILEAV